MQKYILPINYAYNACCYRVSQKKKWTTGPNNKGIILVKFLSQPILALVDFGLSITSNHLYMIRMNLYIYQNI
jgi:hypothetical protein